MSRTRILLVDEQPVVVAGIKAALDPFADLEVAGEASSAEEAIEKAASIKPHMVILDIDVFKSAGIEVITRLKKAAPRTTVIIFTMSLYREFLDPSMSALIRGYVLKQDQISELCSAVLAAREGRSFLSKSAARLLQELMRKDEAKGELDVLTTREKQVFKLIAEGLSIKETAELLGIRLRTAQAHKYKVQEKLKLHSMVDWIREAIRRGVLKAHGPED